MGKKPPDNYCVKCLRSTDEKRKTTNRFSICRNCKNIWCNDCLGTIFDLTVTKVRKHGEKGNLYCPLCFSPLYTVKLPQPHDIGFSQPIPPGYESGLVLKINPNVPILHPEIKARRERRTLR